MPKFKDLKGMRFGRLTILERAEDYVSKAGYRNAQWRCQCDCGNVKVIRATNILNGKSRSCGCERVINPNRRTHGFSHSRIHNIWMSMKHRCDKKYSDDFLRYSGRGIKVCKEWEDDFMSFYTWSINNGYSENLSIDRINNDGNYCPENCRWTNAQVQQNNKSNNHCITFQGATHTIAEWAQITGLSRGKIKDRLMKCGWDIERALTTP